MKIFKVTGIFLSIIVLVLLFSVISAITFINPNRFKPLIAAEVMKRTGRHLTIAGNLTWTIFPFIGIKADHLILRNPEGFNLANLAEIDQAVVTIDPRPLLQKKIVFNGIEISGMHLFLTQNAKGQVNWKLKSIPIRSVFNDKMMVSPTAKVMGKTPLSITIKKLNIIHSVIILSNEQKNQELALSDFKLQANNIDAIKPFSLVSTFQFNAKKAPLSCKMNVSSVLSFDVAHTLYTLDHLNLKMNFKKGQQDYAINATGKIIIDPEKKIYGYVKTDSLPTPLKITDLNIPFDYQKGILNLSHIQGRGYQGILRGQGIINLASSEPLITLQIKLINIAFDPLLQDLNPSRKQTLEFKGLGNIDLKIKTQGENSSQLIKNLNGAGRFDFSEGLLKGIDINYFIETARSFLQMQTTAHKNQHQTKFRHFSGTALIQQGVMSMHDLLLEGDQFKTEGAGTFNLLNDRIDYRLQTSMRRDPESHSEDPLNGVIIPINLEGTFKNPRVRLDVSTLTKIFAERQIKNISKHHHSKDKISDQLTKHMPENATELLKNFLGG